LGQEWPEGDFEIIVADGMSDDGTREILSRLAQKHPRLRIVDNVQRITPCGMNAGIRAARGRYIAIMGAHSHYATDYLRQSVQVMEETGADNVGGAMQCEGESWVQRAIAAAHHSPFSVGGARWHDPTYEGPADTVFGGVYRREVFDWIGLFDEEFVRNQDDELNLRLTRSGGRIWHSPRIKSWYRPRGSLVALFQQYRQYGYWKVRVIQKHKIPASVRHLVPGCFLFTLIVLPLLSVWWSWLLWVWLMLVGGYAVVNLTASILTAIPSQWRLVPPLSLVFVCYHFGYGYGFLRGTVDFILLRRKPQFSYTKITRSSVDHFAREPQRGQ
jgi:glycosyltransferase involved in cell wall biosynthesis